MTQIGTRNDTNSAPPNAAIGPPRHAIFAKEPKAYERLFFLCKRLAFRRNTQRCFGPRAFGAKVESSECQIPTPSTNDTIAPPDGALVRMTSLSRAC
jgi:hypothetical protein